MADDCQGNGATRKLADYVASLRFEDFPADVVATAKKCVLDYFGCALFATQTDMGKIITNYCRKGNFGGASILPGFEHAYNSACAALANGTCAHGFELDDVNTPSISHPGAAIIPAAFALAEEKNKGGKKLLEAIAAGYEVMARVGSTIAAAHIGKGFHPTSSFGVFGAAAACCRLLGLNAGQTENAFGLAGSMASGLSQFSISGSMVKRIHAGKAAQQGVIIAELAADGFTGPPGILEGKLGFCRVFRDDNSAIRWERLTEKLGETWAILDTTFKPSPTCGVLHTSVEAIDRMKKDPDFSPETIEKILVIGSNNLANTHNVFEPDTILAAQYSLPFTLGMAVLGDLADPSPYLNDAILNDKAVLAMARKVRTEFNEELEALYPEHFSAHVKVFLKNGKILEEKIIDPKGAASNPFSDEELYNKYKTLAVTVLPEAKVTALAERIARLERLDTVRTLCAE